MNIRTKRFNTKRGVVFMLLIFFAIIGIHSACENESKSVEIDGLEELGTVPDGVVNGIDTLTGMAYDENFAMVRANCITCHSSKLITQNRATREGWKAMLDWMYETQNLKDLGENEGPILDYLAKHYAPENKGRRANLEDIEWYELESE